MALTKASTNTATLDIRDIKPPVPIASPWPWIWTGLALALAAAAIAWWWRRRNRPAMAPPPPPPEPPHLVALRRLERALTLIEEPKPFCIELSDALRHYLEDRFNLHAPDRTTEEFLDELQANPKLALGHKKLLGDFLQQCDLVKFARHEPGRDALTALHQTANQLVHQTVPVPPPASTVAS